MDLFFYLYFTVTIQNCISDTCAIDNELHFKQSCGVSLTDMIMYSINIMLKFSSLDQCDERRLTEMERYASQIIVEFIMWFFSTSSLKRNTNCPLRT